MILLIPLIGNIYSFVLKNNTKEITTSQKLAKANPSPSPKPANPPKQKKTNPTPPPTFKKFDIEACRIATKKEHREKQATILKGLNTKSTKEDVIAALEYNINDYRLIHGIKPNRSFYVNNGLRDDFPKDVIAKVNPELLKDKDVLEALFGVDYLGSFDYFVLAANGDPEKLKEVYKKFAAIFFPTHCSNWWKPCSMARPMRQEHSRLGLFDKKDWADYRDLTAGNQVFIDIVIAEEKKYVERKIKQIINLMKPERMQRVEDYFRVTYDDEHHYHDSMPIAFWKELCLVENYHIQYAPDALYREKGYIAKFLDTHPDHLTIVYEQTVKRFKPTEEIASYVRERHTNAL